MNIGLLLLLGNLLFGGIDDDKADSLKPNNIPENSELQIDSNPDKEPVKSNTNPPDSTKKDNLDNKAPIITGSVDYIIKQDSYFAFTPKVEDPVNDKLSFSINNLPDWAVFNSNTGSITGEPGNADVGITENITITVIDSQGNKASLLPFDIEVVNINDRPIIAGSPSLIVFPSESYKFKPDVIDKDIEIGRDKLIFSIQNKPIWLSFNTRTGELSGRLPPNHVEYTKDIIITVIDSYGLSDSLDSFELVVGDIRNLVDSENSNPQDLDNTSDVKSESDVITIFNTSDTNLDTSNNTNTSNNLSNSSKRSPIPNAHNTVVNKTIETTTTKIENKVNNNTKDSQVKESILTSTETKTNKTTSEQKAVIKNEGASNSINVNNTNNVVNNDKVGLPPASGTQNIVNEQKNILETSLDIPKNLFSTSSNNNTGQSENQTITVSSQSSISTQKQLSERLSQSNKDEQVVAPAALKDKQNNSGGNYVKDDTTVKVIDKEDKNDPSKENKEPSNIDDNSGGKVVKDDTTVKVIDKEDKNDPSTIDNDSGKVQPASDKPLTDKTQNKEQSSLYGITILVCFFCL